MNRIILLILAVILNNLSLLAQGIWTQVASYGGGNITEARAFSIGNYGYLGGPAADFWRYDPVNDIWTQMANFTGQPRSSPVAFSIGSKGYLGTGGNYNDFFEYDPAANTWTTKTSFGGSGREGALGISINDKGYIGTGGNYLNDWWEYDTTANAWTQKASLAGPGRYHGGAFSISGKGYISTGFNGAFFNDLWEYDPLANNWTAKATMPGITRDRPIGLATATKGYIITGWSGGTALNDAWEYDPVADSWTALPSMPTTGRYNACGFSIGNKLYLGTGTGGTGSDFWEFGPDCSAITTFQATTCAGACDGVAEVTFPDPAAVTSYLWSDGQTTAVAQNLCAGTYTVSVTDTTGCMSITTVEITAPDPIIATAINTPPGCFGDSTGAICVVTAVNPATYLWANGDTSSCLQNIAAGTYTVTVTDSSGCDNTFPFVLSQPGLLLLNINHVDATCSSCPNGSAAAQLFGGTPPVTYLWSTGSTLAFINNLLPGVYTCCVMDVNGCTACDTVQINSPTGINDPEGVSLVVSPNPFSDELVIDGFSKTPAWENLKMFDVSGRIIAVERVVTGNKMILETKSLNSGIYFVEVIGTFGRKMLKVVRE